VEFNRDSNHASSPVSLAQRDLATLSLAAMARQASSTSMHETSSTWTVTITEDQLRKFGSASGSRFSLPAIVYPERALQDRKARGDLRQSLWDFFEEREAMGARVLRLPGEERNDGHWSGRACSLSGADLDSCDASHFVPQKVGPAIFANAMTALRDAPQNVEGAEHLERNELPLLDSRHLSALTLGGAPVSPDCISAAVNGLFLRMDLHRHLDKQAVVFTPSLRCAHITRPRARAQQGEPIGRDRAILEPISGKETVHHTQIAAIHLASLGAMSALHLSSHLCKDFADQGAKRAASHLGLSSRAAKVVRFDDASSAGKGDGPTDVGQLGVDHESGGEDSEEFLSEEERWQKALRQRQAEEEQDGLGAYRFALFMVAAHQKVKNG